MRCSSRNVLLTHQEDAVCILTSTTKTALTTGKSTGTVGITAIQAPTTCRELDWSQGTVFSQLQTVCFFNKQKFLLVYVKMLLRQGPSSETGYGTHRGELRS